MERIGRAIAALTGMKSKVRSGPRRRGITPEGRKRLSEAMKKRWATRKGGRSVTSSKKAVSSQAKRKGMSAAARKRLSDALKKRWAEGKMGHRSKSAR